MHKIILLTVAFFAFTAAAPVVAQEAPNCSGVTNDQAENRLENTLTEDGWFSSLKKENYEVPPASELRVMTNEQDPEACAEIGRGVGEDSKYDFYLYTAGSYYFAVGYPRRENGEWSSPVGVLEVYDEDANAIAFFVP